MTKMSSTSNNLCRKEETKEKIKLREIVEKERKRYIRKKFDYFLYVINKKPKLICI
jgi:hypothetical protein